jgi:hypothetical protein
MLKKKKISEVFVLFDFGIGNHSFCIYQTLKIEMANLIIYGNIYCGSIDKTL